MRWIDHDGIRLAAETFGRPGDPAVVLVMGATASMLGWPDAFCAALAGQGLFVVRFDHRDTGRSTTLPPGAAGYAVEDMAADVLAVLDAHVGGRAHLVGMSLGGHIAQMIAAERPERVATLTLIGSEPLGWDGDPLPQIAPAFLDHFARLERLDWSDGAAVRDFLVETERLCAGSAGPFDAAAARERAGRVLSRTDSVASMFNHATLGLRRDWQGRFRDVACPVLVLHGDEDPILPVENGRALASGIADASLVVLPGTGHEIPAGLIDDLAQRIAAHAGRVPV